MDFVWIQRANESNVNRTNEFNALERISVLVRKDEKWHPNYRYKLGHQAATSAMKTGNISLIRGVQLILEDFGCEVALRGWKDALLERDRDRR